MSDRQKWTLEDYQREIANCRERARKARQSADGWDAEAESLKREAAKFGTEKLPLFGKAEMKIDYTVGPPYLSKDQLQ